MIRTNFLYSVYSQIPECHFVPDPSFLNLNHYKTRTNPIIDPNNAFIFNVQFHTVYGDNGENPNNVDETTYMKILARLNITFNNFNIFFKYRGFNSIKLT